MIVNCLNGNELPKQTRITLADKVSFCQFGTILLSFYLRLFASSPSYFGHFLQIHRIGSVGVYVRAINTIMMALSVDVLLLWIRHNFAAEWVNILSGLLSGPVYWSRKAKALTAKEDWSAWPKVWTTSQLYYYIVRVSDFSFGLFSGSIFFSSSASSFSSSSSHLLSLLTYFTALFCIY